MTVRSHLLRPVGFRPAVVALIAFALLATSSWAARWPVPAVSFSPARAAAQAAPPVPNGGFALHGGIGGQIDERTGQFSVMVPLTTISKDVHASVSVALDWQQQRAAATIDRSGWGAGWSIGSSFVNVAGLKQVYPASGGSYLLDPTEPSGLKHYKLQDLKFTSTAGTLPRRSPAANPVSYSYELAYDDGRADYFDANGNLVVRTDRFGNRTDIAWRPRANNVWQPTTLIDSYGQATTFDYSTPGQVKIVSPERSDGVVATTTIAVSATQGVQSVTDPVGQKITFAYSPVSGAPKPLLTMMTAANGARTAVTYQSPSYEPSLTAVATLKTTDTTGKAVSPVQTFSLDPQGTNNSRHNFTGYPNHLPTATEPDALFASGDAAYTYTTSLTTGATTTLNTYDALHRLVQKQITVTPAAGQTPVVAQTHAVSYPTPVRLPASLPPNYAHPAQTTLTESAATSPDGVTASAPRTTTTATTYDDHGRVVSATDELGTLTTTEYDDRHGLVTKQTTIGADGTQAQMVNTLTPDGVNIATSTTSVGADGGALSARQTLSYEYDDDGQLIKRTLAWAPGAQPDADEPGGGPDEIVTTFERTIDVGGATQSVIATVAAGTAAAQVSITTVDLVSGKPIAHRDAMGRTATFTHDALGRPTSVTRPGGLVTTASYTPTQTTVSSPDGRVTRKTVDLLGRTVSITDNVRNGTIGADPTARTLAAHAYSPDGSSMTSTDQAGRTTTTELDAFGRTVSQEEATGLTHLKSYDDGAAHTTVAALLPDGATQPNMSTKTSYDDADRAIHSQTTYSNGSGGTIADPVNAKEFDGLGQPTATTGNDLTVTNDLSGPGGIAASSTAVPQSTEFPGEPMTAVTTHALAGQSTSRTLHQGDAVSTAVAVQYDAAGNLVSATDPEGRTTTYTYAPDGQPLTKTTPSGTVTTNSYDSASGQLSGITVTAPGQPPRTISYTRVPAGRPGAGQVATVTDGTETIAYGYDVDGHRTSVTYPDGTTTAATYNDKGQLATATDVTGAVTAYVYGADGTLTSATQRRGNTVLASVTYAYDAMSRIATTTRGNGTVTTNTYTDQNQLASQTTTNAAGQVLEAHSYTYDDHYNPATRTDTYAPRGSATATGGTWTTVYSYDAYDRLIGSAVYPGPLTNGQPSGVPVTTTSYEVDLGGDVVATTKTTRLGGIRPITTRSTSTNTIDDSGRLTAQKTGVTTATQTFDADGRVLTSLDAVTTTYLTDGSPATTTLPDGTTTAYALWPDGTRRSATTTSPDGTTSTVTYHYGVDGTLTNDSTADASSPAGSATTASYLLTAGREARTLLAGTATTGKVAGTPAAPIDTGTGVGYYLRDRHTSVTGMVDDTGAVTATYAYADYGTPARADGRPVNLGVFDGGRTNPYTYLGAAARGPLTETATGLLAFADRTYDARQGRFTSPDPVDSHNRYQAFNTNPITYIDLSGRVTGTDLDIGLEVVFAVVAAVAVVLTAGAAAAPIAALAAGEIAATTVISATAAVFATAANVAGMVTNVMLAAGDIDAKIKGKNDWTDPGLRDKLLEASNISAAIAGGLGGVQGVSDAVEAAGKEAAAAAETARAANATEFENLGGWEHVDYAPEAQPEEQVAGEANPANVNPGEAVNNDVQPPPGQSNEAPANNNQEVIDGPNANQGQAQNAGENREQVVQDVVPGQDNLPPPDEQVAKDNPLVGKVVNAGQAAEDFKPRENEAQQPSPHNLDVKTLDSVMQQDVAPVSPAEVVNNSSPSSIDNRNVILLQSPDDEPTYWGLFGGDHTLL